MRDALSIFAAARDAAARSGLTVAGRSYRFGELAELTRERLRILEPAVAPGVPFVVIGSNTLATVITLYALLELDIPALVLHPRLTDVERAAQARTPGPSDLPVHATAIMHTSGTTGAPRAAVLTRSALLASAAASAANLGWEDGDCWLLCMPLARIGGLSILTRCLAARRCVALAEGFDPDRLPERIAADGVTLASLVPTMLHRLLDRHPEWRAPPQLRAVLVGGAAAPDALLQRAQQRGLPIILTYGLTETCSQVVATPYAARHAPAALGVGRALPGARIRIRDGHVEVGGPMLMAGYLGEPALPPDAWFDTGDLGAIDAQGCLRVHARRTDLIVTGGENVYPAEVERVLESCPGIVAAGVFGVPDPVWGQTVAAAVVGGEVPPEEAALAAHLAVRLAPYKRPRQVCYVPELPLTSAGKPDRAALASFAARLRPLGYPRGDG
ncbi:MAG: AMP-binding protein [Betaproteobacteria bacterium]|nr:AMP-binding protein [Betaproteobacteria bacterium]MBK6600530.1 AMP-binding protein [Betaproteobacteria bacterium]MBK7081871.1 AMP-binding protein [Betaproteobacteria bacterium]MBK7593116.1 AMP-binding protein [Betaproteobacteria bacterium]MBK7742696.1 AMP-binding protein [Betaproteobacteria bacterium]